MFGIKTREVLTVLEKSLRSAFVVGERRSSNGITGVRETEQWGERESRLVYPENEGFASG